MNCFRVIAVALVCLAGGVLLQADLWAQGRGGQASPPPTAKAIAPIDLTGYWTAVITEDWHVRMLMPSKGDFGSGVAGTIENPGVGFIGAGLGQLSRPVAIAFGVYGAARSTYSSVFGKGRDVVFPENTLIRVQLSPVEGPRER